MGHSHRTMHFLFLKTLNTCLQHIVSLSLFKHQVASCRCNLLTVLSICTLLPLQKG